MLHGSSFFNMAYCTTKRVTGIDKSVNQKVVLSYYTDYDKKEKQ